MPEAAVHETTAQRIIDAPHNKRGRAGSDIQTVTADNFDSYVAQKTGKEAPKAEAKAETVEDKAKADLAALEAAKAAKAKEKEAKKAEAAEEEIDHPDAEKKGKLNERFKELTEARKKAEAKAEADAKRAREAAERAEAAERDAQELRAKYEPPKGDDVGPEPQPEQFSDTKEFAKALKDWAAESVRIEDAKKSRAERAAKENAERVATWNDAEAAIRQEVPDYDKRLSDSNVRISDQMRDAIVDAGEVGPRVLLHLAEHPEEAERLGKLPVGRMLKEMGKIEASMQKAVKAEAKADAAAAAQHSAAEISRAPAPITPIGGTGDPVVRLSGHQAVPANMTYEEWKAARKSGKIR